MNQYHYHPKSFLQRLNQHIDSATQEMALESLGANPYLMSLQFELTSRCNERCIHCYIPNEKKERGIDLPFKLFKKIIKCLCMP